MRDLAVLTACGLLALAALGALARQVEGSVEAGPVSQCVERWDSEREWLPHEACTPMLHATPRNK